MTDYEEPDENENEWAEGAVPGATEIATVMLEIREAKGWAMWADCQGLSICQRVSVWLDGYSDHDYNEAWLLRVWTHSEPYGDEGRTLTLTDHLAVYSGVDGLQVEWRQDPRLFFDADGDWTDKGLHWWVDWCRAVGEARMAHLPPPSDPAGIAERDREAARAMGLTPTMPYLAR